MKFAAIDVGTNAVRLLLSKVIEGGDQPFFRKEALVRIPLRLGEDTFSAGRISDEKTSRLIDTMLGYRHLIDAYPAHDFIAYATSAMREAENGEEVVQTVRERSGIDIAIIRGKTEAEVIYANHIEERLDVEKNYLYVDVGGGSTELSVVSRKQVIATRSCNVGTVRMLKGCVEQSEWEGMKEWVKENVAPLRPVTAIGSGGNINKIFKLSRVKEGRPISYGLTRRVYKYLASFTLEERIMKLGLRPDRADVILPAARIYLAIMKWGKVKKMYVPQFGLSDGIVHILYERHKAAIA